ncbi:Creatinase/aminopeptidase [Dichomitus squalens LYAD-421 SS1]|uniref:Creatinase/aminopeptidase n=1 Tax=Dichomitus squalens (strain LYAD-421) TaxID=732165 RepID=UPI000441176E|nr:Creatinase/aminopeptidase [Dichomitus squalens LYAD-421 SS1]EJF66002.1 Creatinase/aminopeptidase [Dichomitus squalens LYAD-421 SS1]
MSEKAVIVNHDRLHVEEATPLLEQGAPSRKSLLRRFIWVRSLRPGALHEADKTRDSSDSKSASTFPDFSHLAAHCAHIPPIAAESFIARQDALAQTLHSLGAAAYIAEPGASAGFYGNLSGSHWGLSERPLLLIVQPQEAHDGTVRANISISTPAFEKTRAKLLPIPSKSGVTYTAWPEDVDPFATALDLLPDLDDTIIYVDGDVRTFIADGLQRAAPDARVVNAPIEVRRLRERKSSEEIDILKCVNEVTLLSIRAARKHMKVGIKESEARQLVVRALTAAGLKDAFALTLFGENAALPHGSGTDATLGKHEFVLIDTGGSLHGYHSDVTRASTLHSLAENMPHLLTLAGIPLRYQALWHTVHAAQRAAIVTASNGTVTAAVDGAARKIIKDAGYGEFFTHRLGHGIGLEVHESPYLRGGSDDNIFTGHTFSDEPGIYIEGKVGVRLEDCFYIDEDGSAKFLTAGVGGPASGPWSP